MTIRCRGVLLGLVLCVGLLGCPEDPPEGTPDAGAPEDDAGITVDGGADAGPEPKPWDGDAGPLEEHGDLVDTGPYAPCDSFTVNDAGTPVTCGSLESFALSACDRSTLSHLEPRGIYATLMRPAGTTATPTGGSFMIRDDGGSESVLFSPVHQKRMDGNTFYVSGVRTARDGGTTLYAFAGCEARDVQRFTGCYQRCVNGVRRARGTFDGMRMTWRPGESESSGGLRLLSELRVETGTPMDVYVTRNHAYVVSSTLGGKASGGLTVIDVSDKAHPVLRKTLALPNDFEWNGVWAKGDALYVTSTARAVNVFDISNPADPLFVRGVLPEPAGSHTVLVEGERLYVMSPRDNTTYFFDVSRPLEPVLLGQFAVPTGPDQGFGSVHDAFVYQGRLYVSQMGQGYYVVDVGDSAQPRLLGGYTYPSAMSHMSAVGTFAGRTIAFEGGEDYGAHLRVLDVTDPTRIVKIGQYRLRPHASIHNMVLVGTRLYVAYYHEGLRVLDVSNPTQPQEIAHFNTFRETDPGRTDSPYDGAIGIRVPGDGYVYVVDTARGLLIFPVP